MGRRVSRRSGHRRRHRSLQAHLSRQIWLPNFGSRIGEEHTNCHPILQLHLHSHGHFLHRHMHDGGLGPVEALAWTIREHISSNGHCSCLWLCYLFRNLIHWYQSGSSLLDDW